jgi:hypothetical protein
MNMIRHHFHVDDLIAVLSLLFQKQFFQPGIDWRDKDLAPVFRTPDNMVLAAVNPVMGGVVFLGGVSYLHELSIS